MKKLLQKEDCPLSLEKEANPYENGLKALYVFLKEIASEEVQRVDLDQRPNGPPISDLGYIASEVGLHTISEPQVRRLAIAIAIGGSAIGRVKGRNPGLLACDNAMCDSDSADAMGPIAICDAPISVIEPHKYKGSLTQRDCD